MGSPNPKPDQATANLRPKRSQRIIEAINESNNYGLFEQPFPIEIVEVSPGSEFEILPGIIANTLKHLTTRKFGTKFERTRLERRGLENFCLYF